MKMQASDTHLEDSFEISNNDNQVFFPCLLFKGFIWSF